nr:immunoglobulin light chain junction region [Macaca mulatta]
CQQGKTNPLTF